MSSLTYAPEVTDNKIMFANGYLSRLNLSINNFNDESIKLSSAEFLILEALIVADGGIISKADLEICGWGERGVSESSLTVAITSIRRKIKILKKIEIKTIPRRGYRIVYLDAEVNEQSLTPKPKVDRYSKLKQIKKSMTIKMCWLCFFMYAFFIVFHSIVYDFYEVNCLELDNVICYSSSLSISPINTSSTLPANGFFVLNENAVIEVK